MKEKKIIRIAKDCASTTCPSTSFPYCSEGCISAVWTVEYEED